MTKEKVTPDFVRSPKETAEILGVSKITLKTMELPKIKLSKRRIGYRDSDIHSFLESRRVAVA